MLRMQRMLSRSFKEASSEIARKETMRGGRETPIGRHEADEAGVVSVDLMRVDTKHQVRPVTQGR